MFKKLLGVVIFLALMMAVSRSGFCTEYIGPLSKIKTDRPRLLVRPGETSLAVSLKQLREGPRGEEYDQVLDQLRKDRSASSQAMVWLLTGDTAAAENAIARMRAFEFRGGDTFAVHSRLTDFGLAYDWVSNYKGFTPEIRKEVRDKINPLAQRGLGNVNDHMFHNYVWMSAGGVAMWALAIAGEDQEANEIFERISQRFNNGLFPAWEYQDGLPSEPLGYWALYVFCPGMWTLLASQSAFETDVVSLIRNYHHDWMTRHYENMIHSTLPDMRYIPWGDLQGGPNGGVTMEMAGIMDALAWALKDPQGKYFSNWLKGKRGVERFRGNTAAFYMIYTRFLNLQPSVPPLSYLAGNLQSGHFIARSAWDDGGMVVSLGCQDHFGDHHHYEQGGFMIYLNGLLAVDPPVYREVAGPQQPTSVHNCLLINGQVQRRARGQYFKTIEEFKAQLHANQNLETGDILFYKEEGPWAAVACQYAQAYEPCLLKSCVRQLLFVRPGKVVVVDQVVAAEGKQLSNVQWLLQLPQFPQVAGSEVLGTNGKSWLRCRPVLPEGTVPAVDTTDVRTKRVSYGYGGEGQLTLVHLIEVGDDQQAGGKSQITTSEARNALEVTLDGKTYVFQRQGVWAVSEK